MRDALLTGITLDIFQRHADKVAVAAVAQSINCIHSLMLAQGDKFTVTPTFHVFQMYLPHSGAQAVRAEFIAVADGRLSKNEDVTLAKFLKKSWTPRGLQPDLLANTGHYLIRTGHLTPNQVTYICGHARSW